MNKILIAILALFICGVIVLQSENYAHEYQYELPYLMICSNGFEVATFIISKDDIIVMTKEEKCDLIILMWLMEKLPYTFDEEIIDDLARDFLPKRIWERKS